MVFEEDSEDIGKDLVDIEKDFEDIVKDLEGIEKEFFDKVVHYFDCKFAEEGYALEYFALEDIFDYMLAEEELLASVYFGEFCFDFD